MRVLTIGSMYPPHHLGGYELTWRSAVDHMRREGHAVRVLTTDYRNPSAEHPASEPEVARELRWYWHDHDFPRTSPRQRLRLERHNARTFDHHVEDFAPDVVCWWAMGGMSLSLISRTADRGLPAVGVVEDDWMFYGPLVDPWTRQWSRLGPLAPLGTRITGLPTSVDLAKAARWLFASEHLRSAAVERFALPRTEVTPLGIDHGLFREAPPTPDWGWRLLYLGRIDPRKGIAMCVEALALLPGEATLTVAGSGDEDHLAELHRLVDGLGLRERVEFVVRPRDEVPALYAESDVLLFPSLWEEPWGLMPLEAMAVGTPVVASGTGGSKEFLRHEDNCLVFDRHAGATALAAAVQRLADDAALRMRLRHNGLETAARYTDASFDRAVTAALVEEAGAVASPADDRVWDRDDRPGR